MLIFDIGGNKGNYSLKKLKNDALTNVVIVEPILNNCHIISINLKNYKNVVIYNKAVSNESGDINFYECNADSCSTCSQYHIENSCFGGGEQGKYMMKNGKMFAEHYSFKSPVLKETISLDQLIENHGEPDLIKIDVEGYELNVLKSLTSKKSKIITFEWHEYAIDNIIIEVKYLNSIGYTEFSTEIWYEGKFEHDNEIFNYMSCNDFINWLEPIVRDSISKTGDLDKKCYFENNKKIPYINVWGMIWAK